MNSLFDLFSEIILNGQATYYDIPFSSNDLVDSTHGQIFIKQYLSKGEKNELEFFRFLDDLDDSRVKHILSCYYLGVILYLKCSMIKKHIDKSIKEIDNKHQENSPESRFLYLWMLTCIFHDFGYAIENNKQKFSKSDFSKYMKNFPRRCQNIPSVYTKQILIQYERFRECRYNIQDHGIVGAIKLYSDLCELRKEKANRNNDKLFWGEELIEDFRMASWAIACHNIFFIKKDEDNVSCYKHFKLDKLIYNDQKNRKITLTKHPLLFLLCLVDSIDPIKLCTNCNGNPLNKISLQIFNNSISINYHELCSPLKEDYGKRIANIDNWLTDITSTEDGLKIHL